MGFSRFGYRTLTQPHMWTVTANAANELSFSSLFLVLSSIIIIFDFGQNYNFQAASMIDSCAFFPFQLLVIAICFKYRWKFQEKRTVLSQSRLLYLRENAACASTAFVSFAHVASESSLACKRWVGAAEPQFNKIYATIMK